MKKRASGLALAALFGVSSCGTRSSNSIPLATVSQESTFELDAYGPVPADLEKRLTCPDVENGSATGTFNGKTYTYLPSEAIDYGRDGWQGRAAADWSALSSLNLGNMEIVVIDVRRVQGKPHYLYLSNGKPNTVFEPWSSSKFLAVLAAARRSRWESEGRVGLDSTVGKYDMGDMITSIHSYKPKGNVSQADNVQLSNALAAYFLGVAGRDFATETLHDSWLRINDGSEFRGGYGQSPFQTNDVEWHPNSGEEPHRMAVLSGAASSKNMSALVLAEALKRVTQSETDSDTGLAPITAADVSTLLYGSPRREKEMGGMLAGESVFLVKALLGGTQVGRLGGYGGTENEAAKRALDAKTNGRWRVFHKLGAGVSQTRNVAEIVMTAYACLPGWQGEGREFVIATMAHANSLGTANAMTTRAFSRIVSLLANTR